MAITKNTAKAAETKVEKTIKPAAKTEKVSAAKKAAPVAAVEEVAEVASVKLSRKDIAAGIRDKVIASGMAISPKVAEVAAVAYEEVITEALAAGMTVPLTGFGVFSVVHREEQVRPNPQKPGEKVTVPAHNAPKFKAGAKLKQAVNGGAETDAGDDAE